MLREVLCETGNGICHGMEPFQFDVTWCVARTEENIQRITTNFECNILVHDFRDIHFYLCPSDGEFGIEVNQFR